MLLIGSLEQQIPAEAWPLLWDMWYTAKPWWKEILGGTLVFMLLLNWIRNRRRSN